MTEYNIRLNPNCAAAVHTGLKFKAGDKGITFRIAVDELDTTGTTAKIVFLRANGTSVESDIPGADGVYTYKTLGNEFAVPGKTVADVKFYAADARVSTASFVFEVSGDTMDGLGAGAGGYSDRLEQLATEAEDAMKNAENVSKELENLLTVYQNKFGEVGVLNPKGTYNSATTYEAFDLVYYGGVSWLCLQRCTDVTPAEGAYWQLFASADGGNAAKLGGKGASEYALGTDVGYLEKWKQFPSTLTKIENVDTGIYNITTQKPNITDLPPEASTATGNMLWLMAFKHIDQNYFLAFEPQSNRAWLGKTYGTGITWSSSLATTADLANYMPLSGGTAEEFALGYIGMIGDSGFKIVQDGSILSYLTFSGRNKRFEWWDPAEGYHCYQMLDTRSKPSGSYTGNGSATIREIKTGGIGNTIRITGNGYVTIISYGNGFSIKSDGTLKALTGVDGYFGDGNYAISTAHECINASGVTYGYEVL